MWMAVKSVCVCVGVSSKYVMNCTYLLQQTLYIIQRCYLYLMWYTKNYQERTGVFILALLTLAPWEKFTSVDLGPQIWFTGLHSLRSPWREIQNCSASFISSWGGHTLHRPDESTTGRACLSLSYLESPETTSEVLPAQVVMVSTKVGCDIVCTAVMLVEVWPSTEENKTNQSWALNIHTAIKLLSTLKAYCPKLVDAFH